MTHYILSYFPSLIPRFQSFVCLSHLRHSKYLWDFTKFCQFPQKKKDRFDLGSSAFSIGLMIPIFLLVCLSCSSKQLVSCFYAFMNFICHPGRLSQSFHSLCFQWNVANKNLIKHFFLCQQNVKTMYFKILNPRLFNKKTVT